MLLCVWDDKKIAMDDMV